MMVVEMKFIFCIPLTMFVFAMYGLVTYTTDRKKNMCDMTYMFEYPEYLKINLKTSVAKTFPRYNLYIYGEGRYAEELKNDQIEGIPVLFIPGNAGSHRQVRSLASVSMRMGYSLHASFHFNYFAIDFNEEISGLYGGTLNDQTEFVHECIKQIQSLHTKKKKLILVGHSMGGVVAQAIFSLPKFDTSAVSILFLLASPHNKPVIALDLAIVNFYEKMKEAWSNRLRKDLKLIPIISIGGGEQDYLVRSELTSLSFAQESSVDIHVVLNAIPGVWLSTDHIAIVWCKQLVLTMSRSMYDLIDASTLQISTNHTKIAEILKHHYISRSSGQHFPKLPYIKKQVFPAAGQWIEQDTETWRFSRSKILSSVYILVPVIEKANFLIVASGLAKEDWIFGCTNVLKKESTTCSEGENLSHLGEIIPSKSKIPQRQMINIKELLLAEKKYSYLLVFVPASKTHVDILGERYKPFERNRHFQMPSMLERMTSMTPVRILSVSLVEQSVFFNITLTGAAGVFQAANLILETRLCKAGSVVGQGLIRLNVPWSNEDTFYRISTALGGQTTVPIKVHVLPSHENNSDVNLIMLLDPECSIVLSAQFPLSIILSQFIKFYGLLVPGYAVALLLVLLSGQLYSIQVTGACVSVLQVFGKFPTFITLVCLPTVIYHGVWSTGFAPVYLPIPDSISTINSLIPTFILRSLLYLIAFGLIVLLCITFEIFLSLTAFLWIWIKHRSIHNATQIPLTEKLKGRLELSITTVLFCALFVSTAVGVSSAVAFVHASLFYMVKLIGMRAKCKAEEERRGVTATTCKWHLHFVLALLWLSANALLLPGVVAWAKGLPFSLRTTEDPHLIPSIVLFCSLMMILQLPTPTNNRAYYSTASHAIHILGFLSVLYGIQSVYRLLYFICAAFFVLSIQQIFATPRDSAKLE